MNPGVAAIEGVRNLQYGTIHFDVMGQFALAAMIQIIRIAEIQLGIYIGLVVEVHDGVGLGIFHRIVQCGGTWFKYI